MQLRKETNLYDDFAISDSIAEVNGKIVNRYGTCSTAAGTAAKVVNLTGFTLFTGARVTVRFTNANTASSPTLNVNSTGAKAIWANSATIVAKYYWAAKSEVDFTYDGTHWVMTGQKTQDEIFAELTNGSANQGLYITNGTLYINAEYINTGYMKADRIQGGTLTLGGADNGSGILTVKNSSGTTIVTLNNAGIDVNKGTITGASITLGGSSDGNGTLVVKNASNTTVVTLNRNGINATAGTFSGQLSSATGSFSGSITNQTSGTNPSRITISSGSISIDDPTSSRAAMVMKAELAGSSLSFTGADYYKFARSTTNTPALEINAVNSSMSSQIDVYGDLNIWRSLWTSGGAYISADLMVEGSKERLITTSDYGKRALYAYETPTPYFGDIGDGVISNDGKCYISVESIFAETVSLNNYQVFLQKYDDGDCFVSEKHSSYFVVTGTPGLSFGWEIKSKQSDFDQVRLEKYNGDLSTTNQIDYGGDLLNHINQIRDEREVA